MAVVVVVLLLCAVVVLEWTNSQFGAENKVLSVLSSQTSPTLGRILYAAEN